MEDYQEIAPGIYKSNFPQTRLMQDTVSQLGKMVERLKDYPQIKKFLRDVQRIKPKLRQSMLMWAFYDSQNQVISRTPISKSKSKHVGDDVSMDVPSISSVNITRPSLRSFDETTPSVIDTKTRRKTNYRKNASPQVNSKSNNRKRTSRHNEPVGVVPTKQAKITNELQRAEDETDDGEFHSETSEKDYFILSLLMPSVKADEDSSYSRRSPRNLLSFKTNLGGNKVKNTNADDGESNLDNSSESEICDPKHKPRRNRSRATESGRKAQENTENTRPKRNRRPVRNLTDIIVPSHLIATPEQLGISYRQGFGRIKRRRYTNKSVGGRN